MIFEGWLETDTYIIQQQLSNKKRFFHSNFFFLSKYTHRRTQETVSVETWYDFWFTGPKTPIISDFTSQLGTQADCPAGNFIFRNEGTPKFLDHFQQSPMFVNE